MPGRRKIARVASEVAFESISAQCRWCASVVAFTMTVGEPAARDWAMSVIGGAPVTARSTCGTRSSIESPGLNPSLKL